VLDNKPTSTQTFLISELIPTGELGRRQRLDDNYKDLTQHLSASSVLGQHALAASVSELFSYFPAWEADLEREAISAFYY